MYGKLDEKMNRDDGVPLADPAWRKAEKEKSALWSLENGCLRQVIDAERAANIRLECLRIADQSFSGDATRVVDVADQYAAFVLGGDTAAEDTLMARLSRIAEDCRNAGV